MFRIKIIMILFQQFFFQQIRKNLSFIFSTKNVIFNMSFQNVQNVDCDRISKCLIFFVNAIIIVLFFRNL